MIDKCLAADPDAASVHFLRAQLLVEIAKFQHSLVHPPQNTRTCSRYPSPLPMPGTLPQHPIFPSIVPSTGHRTRHWMSLALSTLSLPSLLWSLLTSTACFAIGVVVCFLTCRERRVVPCRELRRVCDGGGGDGSGHAAPLRCRRRRAQLRSSVGAQSGVPRGVVLVLGGAPACLRACLFPVWTAHRPTVGLCYAVRCT
jgi:hypothetical protein